MKKILLIVSNLRVGGGAEKSAKHICEGLIEEGIKLDLLTFYNFNSEYHFKGNRYSLGFSYKKGLMRYVNILILIPIYLFFFIKKNKYKVIISHSEDCNFCTQLIKLLYRKMFFLTNVVHNNVFLKSNNYYLFRKNHSLCDRVVTVSKGIEKKFIDEGIVEKKSISTIYNMFDIGQIKKESFKRLNKDDYELINNGKYTFITVGRLNEQKDHLFMLECFNIFYMKNKNSQLLIIYGDGELLEQLIVKKNGLEAKNAIHFLGKRNNPYPLLKFSDCFLFTSAWEGFGMVLLEALICDTPIISTNCNYGPKEIIDEVNKRGVFGYLSSVGDYKGFLNSMEKEYLISRDSFDVRLDIFSKNNIISQWVSEVLKGQHY